MRRRFVDARFINQRMDQKDARMARELTARQTSPSLNIPTLAEVEAERVGKSFWKGQTRLQEVVAARPLTKVTEKDFKHEVWTLDKHRCRCCDRQVQKIIGRVPERGEVHHVHGRTGDLRFESKTALLLCLECHERVTGKVNDKLVIVPTKFVEINGEKYTNARAKVTFRELR